MAEPVDGRQSLTTRNDEGLFPDQVRVMTAVADGVDQKDLDGEIGIKWKRVQRWLREDTQFRDAWDKAFGDTVDSVRRQAAQSSDKAVATLDELMDAMKPVTKSYQCTHCGGRNTVQIHIPDAAVRRAAAETMTKLSGAMKTVSKVEFENTNKPNMFQLLDLLKLEKGVHVSPGKIQGLKDAGYLEQSFTPDVVDGEYKVVEEDNDGEDGTSDIESVTGTGVQPEDGDPSSPV